MAMVKSTTATSSQLSEIVKDIKANPDNYDKEPFQILDNIYYVGNSWVGAFLIDTGNGLVLVDSNFPDVLHILLKNIRKVGYEVSDIKWLLISHGHFDHTGGIAAIQKLTNCETWFPKDDHYILDSRPDIPSFRIDHYYDYDSTINCGGLEITPVHTPGHTLGCTSLFFKVPYGGREYRVGIHGGLGQNGLTRRELEANGLPLDLSQRYKESLEMVREFPVDVFLPLHNAYYDIFSLAEQDSGDHSIYIQPEHWKAIMDIRIEAINKLMETDG